LAALSFRYGKQHLDTRYVPRVLIWCIRSKVFMGVSCVPVRLMALALFTTMSMPPNCLTAVSTDSWMAASDLTSTTTGSALPPRSSSSLAAV